MEKIIHQIWVGPLDMPVRERCFVRDIKLKNPNWKHVLWTDQNLPELPKNIKEMYDIFGKDKSYAFQADLLRLFLIKEYGGLYIDVDFEPINSFDELSELEQVFCLWDDLVLNGVFGCKKNNIGLTEVCDNISTSNTWYGPSWFTKVMKPYINTKITLSEFEEKYAKHYALNSWNNK